MKKLVQWIKENIKLITAWIVFIIAFCTVLYPILVVTKGPAIMYFVPWVAPCVIFVMFRIIRAMANFLSSGKL